MKKGNRKKEKKVDNDPIKTYIVFYIVLKAPGYEP